MSRIYPEIILVPLLTYIPILILLYFVIYFAVLSALKRHEKTKSL